MTTPEYQIFSLGSNPKLGNEIAKILGTKLSAIDTRQFADNEIYERIEQTVRGRDLYVIQGISDPVNDNFMKLMIFIDAARRASANTINVVLPYFGYARADRKARSREPISARLIANMLESQGVKRVITMDLHADQVQGFFDIPVDHLLSMPALGHYFYENDLLGDDLVVVAPDHSSVGRARKFAELLHAEWAVVDRRVDNLASNKSYAVTGNVTGKRAILVDDIIDTGTSMVVASEALVAAGVTKIYAVAPHAVFSDQATNRLIESAIQQVIITNTIEVPVAKQFGKLIQISVASPFAETIRRVNAFESIEDIMKSPDNLDVML
ncbi:ribose-phosphate pyrophosphokinase [Leuconostoc gelidum subsp. gelidum]|uniref:ribose-phosphate diphosphokinase n=1 Tax=Leuconostoc gelidum subsp. gelidum TaxID=1607839 RepID=A0ABS7V5K1_LEUGE|nr:ribose-phosphate pyrophosphokinase [Leuconostoc gelidum]MBZ5963734.1 ribose-phosphate pyrophosphokinase [Leuconostoc gelidum subsp. gelidum]MBZ5975423.1 ribose-phosphate pyrophosphokinase [Leuconostoc gelidum subsp. gelidum]MBZ5976406.1 ribose-phosphate pyrophosphokinase [Leuconostoc gelidum subsp. gelidum]MBZ5987191.1 ribose-phosphate pyrophosphokinase [Leuconostoc gelidum subsp. gelidum]MBZ6000388.1 ribose-phosphate pyrophosphokinase [Leuconostoc gelidum subsp. gelidum]